MFFLQNFQGYRVEVIDILLCELNRFLVKL